MFIDRSKLTKGNSYKSSALKNDGVVAVASVIIIVVIVIVTASVAAHPIASISPLPPLISLSLSRCPRLASPRLSSRTLSGRH